AVRRSNLCLAVPRRTLQDFALPSSNAKRKFVRRRTEIPRRLRPPRNDARLSSVVNGKGLGVNAPCGAKPSHKTRTPKHLVRARQGSPDCALRTCNELA